MKTHKLGIIASIALGGLVALAPLANAADDKDAKPDKSDVKPEKGNRPPGPPGEGRPGRPGGPAGERGAAMRERFEKFQAELNLTSEQKEKVHAAMQEEQTKIREMAQDSTVSREDRRAKMKEITDATDKKVLGVLKDEQKEKWTKFRAQNRRPGGNRPPPPPDAAK